jgi:aldose 1-epimerase
VGFGFNCFQFTAVKDGRPVELLWAEPGFESGTKRASGSGIPIMFPFAGRIPGTIFRWENREYQLAEGDGIGNAIHGFVMTRPWRVAAQTEDSVTGQFQASVDDPSLLECWPADFRITCTYRIEGTTLDTHVLLENPDQRPLPYGFGTHPYFRLSLGGASSEDCIVRLPVSHQWELVDMLPTGVRPAVANAGDLQRGLPFREMTYDNIFTGLQFDGDCCAATIHDPLAGKTLFVEFNRIFRELVVYTPPHREAICIEPETCVPNAFDLSRRGLDAGPTQMPPGGRVEGRIRMRLE